MTISRFRFQLRVPRAPSLPQPAEGRRLRVPVRRLRRRHHLRGVLAPQVGGHDLAEAAARPAQARLLQLGVRHGGTAEREKGPRTQGNDTRDGIGLRCHCSNKGGGYFLALG